MWIFSTIGFFSIVTAPTRKGRMLIRARTKTDTGQDDEDRAIFREVGMNLYSQGIKPSDNLVLRAALRLMPRDHRQRWT